MITLAILILLALGVFLSALFSGSETGFYRVTRMRLLLDGMDGDRTSTYLLALTNHPALFVATTLIGNNVANYMTSLAIVMAAQRIFLGSTLAELLAPMILSPLVFVYCELLPKQLFFYAPNSLLRRSGPLILLFTILFTPISALLWGLGRVLESVLGQTPLRLRRSLAREELQQLISEGEDAGVLKSVQQDLAQNLFVAAAQPITRFTRPAARVPAISLGASKTEALRLARRHNCSVLPVREKGGTQIIGYSRVIDLLLSPAAIVSKTTPIMRIPHTHTHIKALILMQSERAELACVEDQHGKTVGLLLATDLTKAVFGSN
jgi:CBS domain containing-hemolysin-like protein